MLLLQIIPFVVIICFVFFAARYFILNSLRNRLQRKQAFRSVILLLYFLPVFLQGLFLFCFALEYFYVLTANFYFLFNSIVFKHNPGGPSYLPGFRCVPVTVITAMLLAVNTWLAGISANLKTTAADLAYKFVYTVYAALMVFLTLSNAVPLLSMSITGKELFFYNNGFITGAGLIAWVILLFLSFRRHSGFKLASYSVLAARVAACWIAACFLLALLLFLLYVLLKVIF